MLLVFNLVGLGFVYLFLFCYFCFERKIHVALELSIVNTKMLSLSFNVSPKKV